MQDGGQSAWQNAHWRGWASARQNARRWAKRTANRWSAMVGRFITLSGKPALLPSHLHITVDFVVWYFIAVRYDVMVLVWCRWLFLFCTMLCYCILWVILLAQSHKCFRVIAMLLVVFLCHRSQSKVDCCIFLWYLIFQFRLVSLALVAE